MVRNSVNTFSGIDWGERREKKKNSTVIIDLIQVLCWRLRGHDRNVCYTLRVYISSTSWDFDSTENLKDLGILMSFSNKVSNRIYERPHLKRELSYSGWDNKKPLKWCVRLNVLWRIGQDIRVGNISGIYWVFADWPEWDYCASVLQFGSDETVHLCEQSVFWIFEVI